MRKKHKKALERIRRRLPKITTTLANVGLDKDMWWLVASEVKPGITWSEFERMWTDFNCYKRKKKLH